VGLENKNKTPSPSRSFVQDPSAQRKWLETIRLMHQQPNADEQELNSIRDHIFYGVSLPLLSVPPPIVHSNTKAVLEHVDLVRARLLDYIDFGAVVRLPAGTQLLHGLQPLHVVVKPDKKPRLVIDLSRNLNAFLKYQYFS